MHSAIILIVIAVFLSGALLTRQSLRENTTINQKIQEATDQRTPTQEESSPTATLTQQPTKHLSSTQTPFSTPTTHPTKPEKPQSLNDFFYPNSKIISSSEQSLILQGNDTPEIITTWYEQYIQTNGYRSKTFAKTNTNGTVVNKLGAEKDNTTLTIEITKKPQESSTTIRVTQTKNNSNNKDIHIRIEQGEPYL